MKFTVMGFSQKGLVDVGLDSADAMLLRYFVDFKATNKMKFEVIEDKLFFWVNYDNVLKELPILNMKKRTIQARFLKLRDLGVLTHYVKKEGGTYSFFGIGHRYEELIANVNLEEDKKAELKEQCNNVDGQDINLKEQGSDAGEDNNLKGNLSSVDEKSSNLKGSGSSADEQGSGLKGHKSSLNGEGSSLDGQGMQFKLLTNNPSTKDSSTKNIHDIVDYLNEATGKSFKYNTKATVKNIEARFKEGFILEDFKIVIDNMVYNWTGTRFQQYLAPSTLFSSKFEAYLLGGKVQRDREFFNKEEVKAKGRGFGSRGGTGLKQGNVAAFNILKESESQENSSKMKDKAKDKVENKAKDKAKHQAQDKVENLRDIFGEDM